VYDEADIGGQAKERERERESVCVCVRVKERGTRILRVGYATAVLKVPSAYRLCNFCLY